MLRFTRLLWLLLLGAAALGYFASDIAVAQRSGAPPTVSPVGQRRGTPPPPMPGTGRRRGSAPPQQTYQVDPLWPKPMGNAWILGSVTGVAVDNQNHIWLVHRGQASMTARTESSLEAKPPGAELCCRAAPPVLEFDQAGTIVSHWGGPGEGYTWPQSPGGMVVDAKGNVWIAAAGTDPTTGRGGRGGRGGTEPATPPPPPPPQDAHILKFSRTGKFILQIGQAGKPGDSASTTGLNRPVAVDVDVAANEVYVADGAANRRIVVFDATTGAYKRHWGAYGAPPDQSNLGPYDPNAPPAKQFRTPSCVKLAKDGLVYVCDRQNNRIQVFKKDGAYVAETFIAKTTLGNGAVWDIAFSNDPKQQFMYVADGQNQQVVVLQRDTLQTVSSFGAGGRWPGHFYGVGSIAVDAKGNVYTGETFEGKRLQKFVRK